MIAGIRRLIGIEPAGPVPPPIHRPVVADPSPQDLAAVQAACGGWAVMWSRWRRAYTAFATFVSELEDDGVYREEYHSKLVEVITLDQAVRAFLT